MSEAFRICPEHAYGDKTVKVFHTEVPTLEANIALSMMEKWGAVAAIPDGEDSAGRQRHKLSSPEEVAAHAFDIAAAAMAQMRARGLLLKLPDLNEINAETDAKRAREEAEERAKKEAAKKGAEQTA